MAEGGTDGERTAAQRILDELIKKYNISDTDINSKKESFYLIDAGEELYMLLFQQIYAARFGEKRETWYPKKGTKKRMREYAKQGFGDPDGNIVIKCTDAEFVEVKALFEIYKADVEKQLKTFMYAYYLKNDLLVVADDDEDCSEEEKEKIRNAVRMAQGIDKKKIHKMIEST